MNERDAWFIALGLAGLAAAVIMLSWSVQQLKMDLELLRITAAVPEMR